MFAVPYIPVSDDVPKIANRPFAGYSMIRK